MGRKEFEEEPPYFRLRWYPATDSRFRLLILFFRHNISETIGKNSRKEIRNSVLDQVNSLHKSSKSYESV